MSDVQTIVQQNRNIFEPDSEAVIEALESLRKSNIRTSYSFDPINDQENHDVQFDIANSSYEESFDNQMTGDQLFSSNEQIPRAMSTYIQVSEISDDDLRQSVRSLNSQQRKPYNIELSWCRNKVKNMGTLKPVQLSPIHLFIAGGAGAGKSHLIKAIYHTVTKNCEHAVINSKLPTVLLMAPTGVATINISETTVHSALGIPYRVRYKDYSNVRSQKNTIKVSFGELKLIIIDEVSVVSNITLLQIHQRLQEIFAAPTN